MPPSVYTKLTGRSRRLGGYTQWWLAPNHLLLVNSTRFAEEYKRFSLSDIQSIVITELPSNVVLQVVMILAALAWMSLWFVVGSRFGKWFIEVSGILALLWPIIDIARGPRCRGFLHTRVSRELLEPVNRISSARRFLAMVRPRIEAVQGTLSAEALIETPQAAWEPPAIASKPGYLPEIAFGFFLLNAALIWLSANFPKIQELPGLLLNTLFVELVLIVAALLRRRGRDQRVVVYVVLSLSLVGIGYDLVAGVRDMFGWFMKHGAQPFTGLHLFMVNDVRTIVAYSWRSVAGLIGLAAAFWEREK